MVSFTINNTWQEIIPPDAVGTISNENDFKINIAILPASPTNENFFTYNAYEKIAFNIPDGDKLFVKTNGILKFGKIRIDEDNIFGSPAVAKLLGANGEPIESLHGAINIHDADVHSVAFNEFFHEHTEVDTTLAIAATKGDTSITVVDASSIVVGDTLQIENGTVETTFPQVTVKVGDILTLDRPLDFSFASGDIVEVVESEMAVLATLAAPRSFKLIPDGNQEWHVISLTVSMTHSTTGDDSLFGNIVALTNGLVFRGFNGTANQYRTNSNWKKNGDFYLDFGSVQYTDKAGGGLHGTKAEVSIKVRAGAIPDINGANGDYLEILVQDNLLAIESLRVKSQGHVII